MKLENRAPALDGATISMVKQAAQKTHFEFYSRLVEKNSGANFCARRRRGLGVVSETDTHADGRHEMSTEMARKCTPDRQPNGQMPAGRAPRGGPRRARRGHGGGHARGGRAIRVGDL